MPPLYRFAFLFAFATFHFHGFKYENIPNTGVLMLVLVLRLMISSHYFYARKYVYGTDTEITDAMNSSIYHTMASQCVCVYTYIIQTICTPHHNTMAEWTNIHHICILLLFPVLWSEFERNGTQTHTNTHTTMRLELKNLFWRCYCYCCCCCYFFRKRQLNEMCSSFLSRQIHKFAAVVVVVFLSFISCHTTVK